jgi:hypothetical protein
MITEIVDVTLRVMMYVRTAPRNAPYRYGLADPALRFQAAVISRYRSELATSEPQAVWEGTDRAGTPREIDIVARLSDGRMMTGAVKWGVLDGSVHIRHLRDLEALAESGGAWAHEALASNAPLIYVTGAGFAPDIAAITQASGHPVVTWTLDELYGPRPPRRRSRQPSGPGLSPCGLRKSQKSAAARARHQRAAKSPAIALHGVKSMAS